MDVTVFEGEHFGADAALVLYKLNLSPVGIATGYGLDDRGAGV
jgi:hypothetical protein